MVSNLSLRWLIKGNEVECMSSGLDRNKKERKTQKKQRLDPSEQTLRSSPEMSASTENRTVQESLTTFMTRNTYWNVILISTIDFQIFTSVKLRESKQLHSFFRVSGLSFTCLRESRSPEKTTVQVRNLTRQL